MKKYLFLLLSFGYSAIINIPEDYSTIQAGIDASVDGDTVVVYPGLYTENIVVDKSTFPTPLKTFGTKSTSLNALVFLWYVTSSSAAPSI